MGIDGLRNMSAGTNDFSWYDTVGGTIVVQNGVAVSDGDQTWQRPSGIGNEVAVYMRNVTSQVRPNPPEGLIVQ